MTLPPPRRWRRLTLWLPALALVVACAKRDKSSENPDELELPPETKVADSRNKDKKGDAKVTAKKVEGGDGPAVLRPQDRDPEQEKSKMSRSRERSAKAKKQLRAGQLDKAIDAARAALREHEQNVEAMLVIAEAFYKQGKHELVESVTGSILKVDAKVLAPEEKSQAYNLMGFAYLQAGKRGEAYQAFRNAAETDEANASAWNNLGVQYMWRGDPKTAESCFEYATGLDPKFADAQLNYGASLRANGKLGEAIAALEQAAKLRPNWAEVHFNLGVLHLDAASLPQLDELGRLEAAIDHLEKYKTLAAKGKSSIERSSRSSGPTDAMGNELVSVAQADLYIKAANKAIESEKRRAEREKKREKRKNEEAAAEQPAEQPSPQQPDGVQPDGAQPDGAQPEAPKGDAPKADAPKGDGPAKPQQPQKPAPSKPKPQKPKVQKPGG